MTTRYVEIPPENRPGTGERCLWRVESRSIALFNVHGVLYAIDDTCPHAGASLANGMLNGRTVQCRAHGLRFDLATGCMPGAKGFGVRTYPVEWRGEQVFLVIEIEESVASC